MGKNQSASNLTNIIKQDANGSISFMSGSTMLMALSNTGQMSGSAPAISAVTASYADNFTVKGTLTAQTIVSQVITSSTSLITGSTQFGTALNNTHVFSGSVTMNPGGLFASSSGLVGIGTTNPTSKLTIRGTDSTSMLYLGISGSSANGEAVGITFGSATYDKAKIVAYNENSGNAAGYLTLWTGGSPTTTDMTERMRITSAGNIGIGTTNPAVKVDVVGSSTDTVKLRVKNTNATGSAGIILNPEGAGAGSLGDATVFYDVNNTAWVAGVDKSDSSKFKISNDVYGDFRANNFFTVTTAGRVGIGTVTPTKTLEVNGRMSTTAIVSGGIIAGNIATNMPAAPSYIPIFNLGESAGFSLTGFVNAASYTCFNISQIYIRKQYTTSTINAGITGFYKSACDFSIVNITYSGATYVALRFTGDPEIDVVWTGYLLTSQFNSDGSAQVWTSGVTLNSTYASY